MTIIAELQRVFIDAQIKPACCYWTEHSLHAVSLKTFSPLSKSECLHKSQQLIVSSLDCDCQRCRHYKNVLHLHHRTNLNDVLSSTATCKARRTFRCRGNELPAAPATNRTQRSETAQLSHYHWGKVSHHYLYVPTEHSSEPLLIWITGRFVCLFGV